MAHSPTRQPPARSPSAALPLQVASGTQYKHTSPPSSALAVLPSPVNTVAVRFAVANPRVASGGVIAVSWTITNTGTLPVTLDALVINGTTGMTPVANTAVLSSGGAVSTPTTNTGSTPNIAIPDLTVPAGTTLTLSLNVSVTAAVSGEAPRCISGYGAIYSTGALVEPRVFCRDRSSANAHPRPTDCLPL